VLKTSEKCQKPFFRVLAVLKFNKKRSLFYATSTATASFFYKSKKSLKIKEPFKRLMAIGKTSLSFRLC
jgi:hypothetical protein